MSETKRVLLFTAFIVGTFLGGTYWGYFLLPMMLDSDEQNNLDTSETLLGSGLTKEGLELKYKDKIDVVFSKKGYEYYCAYNSVTGKELQCVEYPKLNDKLTNLANHATSKPDKS